MFKSFTTNENAKGHQWFLTFFATCTPKSQKNNTRTPKLLKCTTGGPLTT